MVAPKRREKMACQRSMTQKKGREREKGVTMPQKKKRQGWFEREKPLPQGVSRIHPSIHPLIHLHLLIEIA